MDHTLTRIVFSNQHHQITKRVLNSNMATIGERIQRARLARQMSGEELALAVGYKQQSAISNLENRGTGTGGNKLPNIARVLRVPLTWLIEGPDEGEIPFSEPLLGNITAMGGTRVSERAPSGYSMDASQLEAIELFKQLRTQQRLQAINYMRELLSGTAPGTNQIDVGESDSVPHSKAA